MADKKDLLLIKTQYLRVASVPLGLMYIAQAAEKIGAKVKIIDLSIEHNYKKALKSTFIKCEPRLVGIGGMYEEFEGAKEIAAIIKETMPDVLVVLGGPLGTSLVKECLRDKNIDIVVLKEGESTTQDLLHYINGEIKLPQIKGIAFRKNDEIIFTEPRSLEDIDAIPIPAWHLIDTPRYIESRESWFGIKNLKVLYVAASRGCPYNCIFCDKNIFGQKWRGRNPKNIVDEMILLRDMYGANAILFVDSIFDMNKKWVINLIEEMKLRNVRMHWGCISRVDHADYELYKKMHDALCCYVFFGIEFGSDEMLQKTRKQTTVEQAYKAIEIARRAGLRTVGSHMMGMLDETDKQINETIKFALGSKLDVGGFSIVTPIPGTVLYDMAVGAGKITPAQPWWKATYSNAFINLSKNVSSEKLTYLTTKAYWMFFWSRSSRKLPRWACKFMQLSFYVFSPLTGGERFINFINWLDRVRRRLRLNLP